MKKLNLIFLLLGTILVSSLTACIEDGFTSSPADQPAFSVDTLDLGTIFTAGDVPEGIPAGSPTHNFVVYNRASKNLLISTIALRDGSGVFRLNVDGISGNSFNNVEIRPNDSIFVLVEATLPPNGKNQPIEVIDRLDFVTNGVTQTVVLRADGQDVERRRGIVFDTDTRLSADKPWQVFDSLVVAEGVTLTLAPGVVLYFHDKAEMRVRGTLLSLGTVEQPVEMRGDRTDNVVGKINYEIMSGQWGGVRFYPSSRANRLEYTSVRNSCFGVEVDSIGSRDVPALSMLNSQLRNSSGSVLSVLHSDVTAVGCEFAEAAAGVVWLQGGDHTFNHCIFSNNYLFSAIGNPIVNFVHLDADTDDGSGLPYTRADISNSIIYGMGSELSHGDLEGTGVTLRSTLLKSDGKDDNNFINCLWGVDPLFYTVREDYIFDYRLRPGSPAIGAADPSLTLPAASTDRYGLPRGSTPDLGAYVYTDSSLD